MHPENSFITLTYDDENLPEDYSVSVREVQLFLKKLRFHYRTKKIRYYACGEYGDQTLRPHYHLLLFNHDFSDKTLFKKINNKPHYTSQTLTQLWAKGLATTSQVSYQSAAYTARYIIKKQGGETEATTDYYTRRHPISGQIFHVEPEFAVMSTRPGLGESWLNKYKSDVFPCDFVVVDGKKHPVPRYYILKLQEEELERIKRQRRYADKKNLRAHGTKERLAVRQTVLQSKIKFLKRDL